MKILLAEDDQRLGQLIYDYLLPESEIVDVVNTGLNIAEKIQEKSYDILILDVMLPKKNGIDICQELRKNGIDIAILFITALNNQNDKIKAFESGADDYLIKPFDFAELLVRVKALLRRETKVKSSNLMWNDLILIPEEKLVIYNQDHINLTPTEFKILQIFLSTPNKVFSPESIIDKLWDIDTTPTNSTLRTHIKSLRKKLEEKGLEKNFIETVYGMGYRLKPKPEKLSISHNSQQSLKRYKLHKKKNIDELDTKEDKLKQLIEQMWLDNQDNIKQDCQILSDYIQGKNNNLDVDNAIRIAHNFVGFLGSIGFENASKISKEIENIIKYNRDNLHNQQINSTLINLLNDLQSTLFPEGEIINSQKDIKHNIFDHDNIEILVVDEDLKLANNLIMFMNNPQVSFIFVHSIERGIEYIKEKNYPIVILETQWKKDNSNRLLEILDLLKEKQEITKTIIYSKNDSLENRLYCSKYPISTFLYKNNSLDILWENIKNILLNNNKEYKISYNYDILIIDDDIRFTEVLRQKLIVDELPVNINIISDSETFLDEIKKIKPQLIILDLQMPKLNGLDICKIIKKDPFLKSIPIIFLTGNLESHIITQFVEAGADDFISKSKIDLELYPRIMTHLKRVDLSSEVI